jgi:hypothetical protein
MIDHLDQTPDSTRTQRIVILGGGFGGVTTAQELTRRLRSQDRLADQRGPAVTARDESASPPRVSVTLINRDNYFVFQPLLADIISGTIETTHVVVPLRRMQEGADVTAARRTTFPQPATTVRSSWPSRSGSARTSIATILPPVTVRARTANGLPSGDQATPPGIPLTRIRVDVSAN